MNSLAAAFDLFRRGLFEESRVAALEIVEEEPQSFWAYYLAAVSSAFQPDLKEFEKHLSELDTFKTTNVYLHYLKAYYFLLRRDIEKALWHYLEITDDAEGWLARSLVKKFRKVKVLDDVAFRVADFIVLPAELPPAMHTSLRVADASGAPGAPGAPPAAVAKAKPQAGWQFDPEKKRPRPRARRVNPFVGFPYRIVFIAGFALFAAAGIFLFLRQNREAAKTIPDLQVADAAAVMPVVDPAKILYTYKTREGIIGDFEKAKLLLKERKVNQSRYLLNRLLHSNADFQTREKSRVFSGFIPDPEFSDFNDNIRLKDLFEHTKLRRDSVVVVSGELRDAAGETGGILYQLIAREGGEEYRVHAYKSTAVKEEKRPLAKAGETVQVYGRFKGLVGEQKAIYLEALRVWR
ncbi:MAG: hypothetical protein J0L53_17085 [Spirochaetes bacterium]|nr:hypothetical protein [Spirochaetota bacterium]